MRKGDRAWRLLVAQLSGTAARYAITEHGRADNEVEAVDELRSITTSPQVLADAASRYIAASDDCWYRGEVVALLIQAGADAVLAGEYARELVAKRAASFDLGAMAERLGRSGHEPG